MKSQKNRRRISNKKIERFGDYFKASLKTIFKGQVNNYLSAYLNNHWNKIVGPSIAKNAIFVDAADKILSLYVWHPAWINEIKNYQEDIISKVNAYAGKNLVKTIKFVSCPPKKNNKKPLANENKETLKSEFKFDDLTVKEKENIKNSIVEVKDEKLREVLKNYRTIAIKKQNYMRDHFIKCKVCGNYITESEKEFCPECMLRLEGKLKRKIVQILTDAPFLTYRDVQDEISGATLDFFNKVRLEMVQRLAGKIDGKDGVTFETKCLTMLFKSLPPDFVTDEAVMETLKTLRYDLASSPIFKKKKNEKDSKK